MSVARRRTVYVPGAANERLATVPDPSSKEPSLSRSQAWSATLPSGASVEVEVKRTVSPVTGACSEMLKQATGARLGPAAASTLSALWVKEASAGLLEPSERRRPA